MLDNLIKFSISNKFIVFFVAIIVTAAGIWTASRMDVDVFPDLTAPTVVVMTDAHGMAAEEVERLVTFPIETAVNGAANVRRVRSVSSQGFSFVWVDFDWGMDIYAARQIVSEKLITITPQMPEGVSQPILAPQTSIMGEIFLISLQADSTDMMELRTIAEWNVKPLLLATEGIAQVSILGGDYKQYQILADPHKMNFYNISMSDLLHAAEGLGFNSSGNVIRQYGNEYVVRGMTRTSDPDEIGNTFIKTLNGAPLRISDVAEVKTGKAVRMGYGSKNASPAVILAVSKQPNANTLTLTEVVERNINELMPSLPPDVEVDTKIFRQADFIETAIQNIQNVLIEAGIFVAIILLIFLGSFRTTFISLLAIPLSLLSTILVLELLGMNINTMSLGGMAIAVGLLVDDAIIDVENAYKRLRQNFIKNEADRASTFQIVFESSKEIRPPIINANLIIIVAFLPLFFLSGMEGRMLYPLGIAFIVSITVSLLVAMTVTPMLCKVLMTNEKYLLKNKKEKWLTRTLLSGYEKTLKWSLKYRKAVLTATVVIFIFSLLAFSTLGRSFLPEFNEGSLTINFVTKPGTSLEETNLLGNLVEEELLSIPEVVTTARRTGRGELDEHAQASSSTEMDVNFNLNDRQRSVFLEEVREKLDGIPGIAYTVGQPLGHRIDHMLSGTEANIAIKVFGSDLNRLYQLGNQIQFAINDIENLVDINVEQQVEVPQLHIRANREMLVSHGITIKEFNDFVETAFGGMKIGDVYEGQKRFDLIVRLNENYTETMEGIGNALIDTDDGKKVPLINVAEIISTGGPGMINRENVQRLLVVSANVSGGDLRGTVNQIRSQIESNVVIPEGYRVEYGGQFESEERASQILFFTSILSILLIFIILFRQFSSFKLGALILINLPLALIGGVFAVYFSSGILSIPAIIGFITLFGIATRNGILLISRYQALNSSEYSIYETVIKGSKDRLNPILMTALTAALALTPLVIKGDLPGNEIQSPMALVILGGLLSSTFLNMYIVPIIYSMLKKER